MFVRKRKNGNYQAIVSYRVKGKVVQDVISLGEYPTVQEALMRALLELETIEKQLQVPLSEYKQMRFKKRYGLCLVYLTTKEAEKLRAYWLNREYKQKNRVAKLEGLASKQV